MSDNVINVNPQERLKFAEKMIAFETDMKAAVKSMKGRLNTAEGHLQDPGSKHYIAEGKLLIEAIEKQLNGTVSESGAEQKGKALDQIKLMDAFAGKMGK